MLSVRRWEEEAAVVLIERLGEKNWDLLTSCDSTITTIQPFSFCAVTGTCYLFTFQIRFWTRKMCRQRLQFQMRSEQLSGLSCWWFRRIKTPMLAVIAAGGRWHDKDKAYIFWVQHIFFRSSSSPPHMQECGLLGNAYVQWHSPYNSPYCSAGDVGGLLELLEDNWLVFGTWAMA